MTERFDNIRIGIVAGEVSGDTLGAALMRALKKRVPGITFIGIGGPQMLAEGCESLYPMDKLCVIGLVEALGKAVQILKLRRELIRYFISNPPDLFIGVDAPDFNLGLEEKLKQTGIPTVHYVSPTVWAWRGYRIRKIHKAVDHMLTLFPFEAAYYQEHDIPVTFVGHPLAELIEDDPDRDRYRKALRLPSDKILIAVLPGSRSSELQRHSDVFVKTMQWLVGRHNDYYFVAPFVNREMRDIFNRALTKNQATNLPLTQLDGHSRDAMAAADVVLLASGTAAMEAALLKRLAVVTYKVSFITYHLVKLFAHVELVAMPNNLVGRQLFPEFIQANATPEKLGAAIEGLLGDPDEAERITEALRKIYQELKQNADERAADSVLGVLRKRLPPAPSMTESSG